MSIWCSRFNHAFFTHTQTNSYIYFCNRNVTPQVDDDAQLENACVVKQHQMNLSLNLSSELSIILCQWFLYKREWEKHIQSESNALSFIFDKEYNLAPRYTHIYLFWKINPPLKCYIRIQRVRVSSTQSKEMCMSECLRGIHVCYIWAHIQPRTPYL